MKRILGEQSFSVITLQQRKTESSISFRTLPPVSSLTQSLSLLLADFVGN